MLFTVRRAVDYYKNHKDIWHLLQQRGMKGDYSWGHSAGQYVKMYEKLLAPVSAMRAPVEKEVADEKEEPEPAAQAEVVVTEEKPKAKRTTKKAAPKAEAAEGEEKPKRTRKTAAKAETAEGEEKPKRTRKTAVKAEAAEGEEKPKAKRTRNTAPKAEAATETKE